MTDLTTDLSHPSSNGAGPTDDDQPGQRAPLPAMAVTGAMAALTALDRAVGDSGLAPLTRELVHIRASQLNGCGVCSVQHPRAARQLGETDERIWAVAGWRDAPYFTPAERAALALAEAMTTLSEHPGEVADGVWAAARTHFDEQQLAGLVLTIANVNLWNRLNVTTRQVAGATW